MRRLEGNTQRSYMAENLVILYPRMFSGSHIAHPHFARALHVLREVISGATFEGYHGL